MPARLRSWLAQWGPVLPLLLAEATIWLGFGALLPILPIYFTRHGVDLPTLGVVVAAWPAARLVGEPVFGWLADRVPRRALMVAGLVLAAVFTVLQLVLTGPAAFIALRALSGLAAAMYDPAARAYLVDANPPGRQGEAFGLYGAAQTGGLMLGPAIGGVAAGLSGAPEAVFWVAGGALVVSAVLLAARMRGLEQHVARGSAAAVDDPSPVGAVAGAPSAPPRRAWSRPVRVLNLLLLAAICFNVGSYFAGGVYEVVWSLYLTSLGADIGLIGVTYFTFGLPPLLLSPFVGRFIDRSGGFAALVIGIAILGGCGFLYPLVAEVWWMAALGLVEGTGLALATPAIYLLAARSSPPGRSSTVQGLLGGAGTVGTIVASLAAGRLADVDLALPFYAVGVAASAALLLGLGLGRRRLYDAMQPGAQRPRVAAAAAPGG